MTGVSPLSDAPSILDRVRNCPSLPTLPSVAAMVLDAVGEKTIDVAKVARIVVKDPALAVRILRCANSSTLGSSREIGTLERAITLLDPDQIKALVLGFSLAMSLRRNNVGGFDHMLYWRRSIYAATAAKLLAQALECPSIDECFMAALLMDLGMLAMDTVLETEYQKVFSSVDSHNEIWQAEIRKLSLTHAIVSGELCKKWKLPDLITIPITYHHQGGEAIKDSAQRQVRQIIEVAGWIADSFVDGNPLWALTEVKRTCAARWDMSREACDDLLARVGAATKEMASLFEVSVDPSLSYESLLSRASEMLARMAPLPKIDHLFDEEAPLNPSGAKLSVHELRRAPRFARQGIMAIFPRVNNDLGTPFEVQFRDVSAMGIGILHRAPMQIGMQFIVGLLKTGQKPAVLLYRVVRCQKLAKDKYHIGATLERVLRDEDLKGADGMDPRQRIAKLLEQTSPLPAPTAAPSQATVSAGA